MSVFPRPERKTLGSFALVSILPGKLGMAFLLAFVLGHWLGGSSWLYIHYKLGAPWVIAYGVLLATVMIYIGVDARKSHA